MMDAQDRIAREFRFDVLGQLPGLRRYARSLTRSEIDAEDLVHDALVRAYEKRASFRAGHNMRVWLMSIMHNVFIDGTRARRARSWIHMLVFASTLTVTLYAVTDMEYPRLGLIHIENFDHFLVDAHQQMQPRNSVGTVGSGR